MPSYDARFIPDIDRIPNGNRREHCSAHRSQITTIGRDKGQQVRIERYAPNGVTLLDFALYTVIAVHDEEPDVVFVGYNNLDDLHDRLGLTTTDPFSGKIDSQVTDDSGFVERLTDNGHHRGLIVIAPHGGDTEAHTDEQAERVREQLASKCISVWVCQGFKGGGAFDHLHITSTDISAESFPKLKRVIGRRFEYAVAFHGWTENFICIGGSAPPDLKQQIKTAIERATAGSGIDVATDGDGGCPEGFNGTDPRNIVNRLAANGIQIEQSRKARDSFSLQIADAVADVMRPRIEVCTAPVFEGSDPWTCLMRSIGDSVRAMSRAGMASIPCEIRRPVSHSQLPKGNTDPCIEL